MFLRRKRSVQKSGEYEYLRIVESIREGEKVAEAEGRSKREAKRKAAKKALFLITN